MTAIKVLGASGPMIDLIDLSRWQREAYARVLLKRAAEQQGELFKS